MKNLIFTALLVFGSIAISCGGSVDTVSQPSNRESISHCTWSKSNSFADYTADMQLRYIVGVLRSDDGTVYVTGASNNAHLFRSRLGIWDEINIDELKSATLLRQGTHKQLSILSTAQNGLIGILEISGAGRNWIPGPQNCHQITDFVYDVDGTIHLACKDADEKSSLWQYIDGSWNFTNPPMLEAGYEIAKLELGNNTILATGTKKDIHGNNRCFLLSGLPWTETVLPETCSIAFDVSLVADTKSVYIAGSTSESQGLLMKISDNTVSLLPMSQQKRGVSLIGATVNQGLQLVSTIIPQGLDVDSDDPNLKLVSKIDYPETAIDEETISDKATVPLDLWTSANSRWAYLTTMDALYSCD